MMLVMFTSLANPHFLFDDELARFSLLLQVLFSFSQSGPHSARFASHHLTNKGAPLAITDCETLLSHTDVCIRYQPFSSSSTPIFPSPACVFPSRT